MFREIAQGKAQPSNLRTAKSFGFLQLQPTPHLPVPSIGKMVTYEYGFSSAAI